MNEAPPLLMLIGQLMDKTFDEIVAEVQDLKANKAGISQATVYASAFRFRWNDWAGTLKLGWQSPRRGTRQWSAQCEWSLWQGDKHLSGRASDLVNEESHAVDLIFEGLSELQPIRSAGDSKYRYRVPADLIHGLDGYLHEYLR